MNVWIVIEIYLFLAESMSSTSLFSVFLVLMMLGMSTWNRSHRSNRNIDWNQDDISEFRTRDLPIPSLPLHHTGSASGSANNLMNTWNDWGRRMTRNKHMFPSSVMLTVFLMAQSTSNRYIEIHDVFRFNYWVLITMCQGGNKPLNDGICFKDQHLGFHVRTNWINIIFSLNPDTYIRNSQRIEAMPVGTDARSPMKVYVGYLSYWCSAIPSNDGALDKIIKLTNERPPIMHPSVSLFNFKWLMSYRWLERS